MQQAVIVRVSTTMNRVAVIVGLAAIAGAVWYLRRTPGSNVSDAAPARPVAADDRATPRHEPPITKVTKVAPGERKQLADRIANAQATRSKPVAGPVHAPAAPSLPAEAVDASQAETLRVEIKSAMREVIPLLAECYEAEIPSLAEPSTKIVAELTLTGDPDIGTVVDAKQLFDDTGKPLSTKFDDCLRTTFQSLALPPLAEGDHFEVHYPFLFSKE